MRTPSGFPIVDLQSPRVISALATLEREALEFERIARDTPAQVERIEIFDPAAAWRADRNYALSIAFCLGAATALLLVWMVLK